MEIADAGQIELLRKIATYNRVSIPDIKDAPPEDVYRTVLSRLNAAVFNKAEDWMLPYWVLQKRGHKGGKKDENEDELFNDEFVDYALIGGVGTRYSAIADQKGLLTVPTGWGSLEFWVLDGEDLIFPALTDREGPRLNLVSNEDQVYEWSAVSGPVEFSRMTFHVDDGENEMIFTEVVLQNISLEEVEFTFYVVVRPFSIWGIEPIVSMKYDEENIKLYINDTLALHMDNKPISVVMSTADNPNLPATIKDTVGRIDCDFSTSKGLGTVVLRFDVRLQPAISSNFYFVSPLEKLGPNDEHPVPIFDTKMRDQSVEKWFEFFSESSRATFPERRFDPVMAQAQATLASRAMGCLVPTSTTRRPMPWDERGRLLAALSKVGCIKLANKISLELTKKQWAQSYAERDMGKILWSVLQVYKYGRSLTFIRRIRPFLNWTVPKIVEQIDQDLYEEQEITRLPEIEGLAEEEPLDEPHETSTSKNEDNGEFLGIAEIKAAMDKETDKTITDDTPVVPDDSPPASVEPRVWTLEDIIHGMWNLAAVLLAAESYNALGDKGQSDALIDLAGEYRNLLSLRIRKRGNVDDWGEFDNLTSEHGVKNALGFLSTLGVLSMHDVVDGLAQSLADSVREGCFSRGLVKIPASPAKYSSHLGLRVAYIYALLKNEFEVDEILRKVLDYVSEYHTLPEYVDPKSGGGSHGQACSPRAAADLLILLRDIVVYEVKDDMIVMPAIPEEWFTSTKPLVFERLPTSFGLIQTELGTSSNQHQIEVEMSRLPKELEVHVPTHFSLHMVKVFGASTVDRVSTDTYAYVRVIPLSENVVIAFHKR